MDYCIRFNVNHSYPSTVNVSNLQQCMNYMVSIYIVYNYRRHILCSASGGSAYWKGCRGWAVADENMAAAVLKTHLAETAGHRDHFLWW